MTKVTVRDSESFNQTLQRFNRLVDRDYKRPWYKHRYGYYEKPSVLRRKRRRMEKRNKRRSVRGSPPLKLYIDLEAQFRPTGPRNAMGR